MSEEGKYRFLLSWLLILTVGVSILGWESLTRYIGREQRIAEWNARMLRDSLDREGIPARVDSLVKLKMAKYKEMSIFDLFQLGGNKSASEPAYIAVISTLSGVILVLVRVIVVLHREGKEKDKSLEKKNDVVLQLVEDNITSYKEMTATFQALKPFIKT